MQSSTTSCFCESTTSTTTYSSGWSAMLCIVYCILHSWETLYFKCSESLFPQLEGQWKWFRKWKLHHSYCICHPGLEYKSAYNLSAWYFCTIEWNNHENRHSWSPATTLIIAWLFFKPKPWDWHCSFCMNYLDHHWIDCCYIWNRFSYSPETNIFVFLITFFPLCLHDKVFNYPILLRLTHMNSIHIQI